MRFTTRKIFPHAFLIVLLLGLSVTTSVSAHVISEEDHHAFEHKFADMCVQKEKARIQTHPEYQRKESQYLSRAAALCECIAQEESKRLTIEEVKKFVRENKYPASLMMKSNAATYKCVQQFQ